MLRGYLQKLDWLKANLRIDACWPWPGKLRADGYAYTSVRGKRILSHRAVMRASVMHLKTTDKVLHKCDNRACVNPAHLFVGTQADNVHDMEMKKRAKHPKRGAHGRAKLTEEDVQLIKLAPRHDSSATLGKNFGVSSSAIRRIRRGETWL